MIKERNINLAFSGICITFFMVITDVTAVNVVLPNIMQVMNTTISELQWIVAGYTLTFACFLLMSGHLADLLGAKKILIVGLTLFICSSLACALALDIEWLIIFRLMQGASASILVPCSLSLIITTFSNPKIRARKIGVWASIGGVAAVTGPVMGAFLTDFFSWRAIFFINIPLGIIAVVFIYQCCKETIKNSPLSFDILGQVFALVSIASLSFALIEVGTLGRHSPLVIGAIIVFITSTIFFILVEKKVEQPMLPLRFFKIKGFSIAVSIGMLLNIGVYGQLFVLPLYFQQIRGYSLISTGFALLPLVGVIALSSYLSGKLISHKGVKLPLILGLSVGAIGFFSLLMTQDKAPDYVWLIMPLMAMGFGISCCQPAATITAISALPKDRAGLASAIFTTSRQLGSLLGVTLFGSIIATSSDFVQGFHLSLIVAGGTYLFGLFLACLLHSRSELA